MRKVIIVAIALLQIYTLPINLIHRLFYLVFFGIKEGKEAIRNNCFEEWAERQDEKFESPKTLLNYILIQTICITIYLYYA